MAIWNFEQFVLQLDNVGLVDVILPFLLVFTLFFAILEKTKIMGDAKKNINIVLSLIIGLLVVVPHVTGTYPANWDVVNIINGALPSIALIVVAVIMLMILIGLWGGKTTTLTGSLTTWVFVFSLLVVIWAFAAAAGRWNFGWEWVTHYFGTEVVSFIIIILVIGIIIAFITGGDKTKEKVSAFSKLGDSIQSLWK